MFTTKTIAAGLIALTTLSAVPANAASLNVQFGNGPSWGHHGGYGHQWRRDRVRVSPQEVRRQLRRDGYRAIRFFDDRGAVYQLRASKYGRDYFLVVSARSGDVIARHRI